MRRIDRLDQADCLNAVRTIDCNADKRGRFGLGPLFRSTSLRARIIAAAVLLCLIVGAGALIRAASQVLLDRQLVDAISRQQSERVEKLLSSGASANAKMHPAHSFLYYLHRPSARQRDA